MKKRSSLFLFLVAVLCLSMLFASCDSPAGDATDDSLITEATTDAPTPPESVVADLAAILEKWNTYLTYTDPTVKEELLTSGEEKQLFTGESDDYHLIDVSNDGSFLFVRETFLRDVISEEPIEPVEPEKEIYRYSYKVYNKKTGECIWSQLLGFDRESDYNASCSVGAIRHAGVALPILRVQMTTFELIEAESTEESGGEVVIPEPEYRMVTTYTCYDESGTELASSEESAPWTVALNEADTTLTVTVAGKVYVYDMDGEPLYTFEKGSERYVPRVDFEYGDYLYHYDQGTLRVFDRNYNKLSEHTPGRAFQNAYILKNGNVMYVCTERVSSFEDYDYEVPAYYDTSSYGMLTYVLADAKTGELTNLKRDFLILDLLTASRTESTGIGFSGDYQLAKIQKINDRELSSKYTLAILDNELNIVEELPIFTPNQTGVYGMLDASTLMITAEAYDGQSLYYTVDLNEKTLSMSIDADEGERYRFVDGGFVSGEKLYNNDCEMLYDLSDVSDYDLYSDSILLQDDNLQLAYIENGELVTRTLSEVSTTPRLINGLIVVKVETAVDVEEESSEAASDVPAESVSEEMEEPAPLAEYKIYNARGEQLLTVSGEISTVATGDGYVWIVADGVYYFFK